MLSELPTTWWYEGRIRKCNILDYRFLVLSHNTIRGAAGAAILNAELMKVKEYL